MSAPIWPASLPQAFLRNGFAEEEADNLIISEMSIGPVKMRRRTSANVRSISGAMHMSGAQVAEFRTFVRTTIADRSLAFTFPDPFGGTALLVRMTSPYRLSPRGIGWRVDIDLEVLP
ncbi:hypothetical protein [Mycoplana dimorpha]|uniref:Phage-related protein n=1 Tax=Mycoplana dimorpha TaxID=28320 RepID=A0A2T5B1L6_MYCDI|nr:hypothetical protein [Mycoplana dimorpha]PTM92858.1 hypothetical protein C7449_107272 [Mycoplana dimorpha]